jgi:hypothetical protein
MQTRPTRLVTALSGLVLATVIVVGCAGEETRPLVDRVVLVGVDGLDWSVARPLMDQGRMPNLARLAAQGAWGELDTLLPTYSPNIWASIATGKLPRKHGILDFVAPGPDGKPVPVTSNARRVKALWNLLGEAAHPVAVVGWWTTWPAEPVLGAMVSDRMLFNRFNVWFGLTRFGQDLPAQTYPLELEEELNRLLRDPRDSLDAEFRERFPGAPKEIREDLHDPWYELYLVFARDRAYARMLEHVLQKEEYDLVAFYLNGPDIASHYFWKYRFPQQWPDGIPESELVAGRDVVNQAYAYADELIGSLTRLAQERCLVIVVSDHGFVTGERPDSPNISGVHWNAAPPGVIVMAGAGIAPGTELERGSVLDLTPTILHSLGLPVARDMDGRVSSVVEGLGGPEVRHVDSYEGGVSTLDAVPIPSAHDEAIIERLKALGYLDGK